MSTSVLSSSTICPPLGSSIPLALPHAISVSLPTWRDTVGYEEGEKRVLDAMCTGYPRFFIHKSIQKLASICEHKFGLQSERCILVSKANIANHCRDFIISRSPDAGSCTSVRLAQFLIHPEGPAAVTDEDVIELHIVLFPAEALPIAKQFWQHTGLGISSRLAEQCLALLPTNIMDSHGLPSPKWTNFPARNKHYAAKGVPTRAMALCSSAEQDTDGILTDQATYLEERYGRNMPLAAAAIAKRTLRRRIAGVLVHENYPPSTIHDDELQPSTRGVASVTEDDVYLFPTGMSAIWSAHQLCLSAMPPSKSVCFGFPYTDTLKILQKWGPGCHFFGKGTDSDIEALATLLAPPNPRILALFCEFPSNPLLRSPNLARLRELADRYGFVIVVDETVGNFVNVEILPYADILVSSLTKVFSGETNVMGGSLILNPKSRHFSILKAKLEEKYEDVYWDEDAVYMERNSRDFVKRVRIINRNAEAICDLLTDRARVENSVVKAVYYPKYETRVNYDKCRLPSPRGPDGHEEGNFGGLFSVTFISKAASEAFFDALPCAKGPSLGTSFTLACPYTVLAHYTELEWAAENGVEEGLVRVSVGLEDTQLLLTWFADSLKKAEEAELK